MTSSPRLTYLDTSALMRRAEGLAASHTRRNALIKPVIAAILDDPSRELACSETTLIEYHSNLTTNWRSSQLSDCDAEWWEIARADLLDRIGAGSMIVLPNPPRALEQVMALVTSATRDHDRALRAWDALHASVAAYWAVTKQSTVELVTSDSDFEIVLQLMGLSSRLQVLNLDVAASTGEGADRNLRQVIRQR